MESLKTGRSIDEIRPDTEETSEGTMRDLPDFDVEFSTKDDVANLKKIGYNQYRSEKLAFEHGSAPTGTQKMFYNPQKNQFEVWEKGDDALLIMGTAKRGKEAEKLYEQTYRTTADTVYECTESFENAKGQDTWSSQLSEDRGNSFGNSAKSESKGLQSNTRGSGSNLLEGNNGKSINNEPSSTDGGFSMPKFSTRENVAGFEDYNKPITEQDIRTLQTIGRKSINEFTDEDIKKAQKWAYKFYKQMETKSPFFRAWFGDWRANDNSPVAIANIPFVSENELRDFIKSQRSIEGVENLDTAKDDNKGWVIRISREGEGNTVAHSGKNGLSIKGLTGIRELIKNAVLLETEIHDHHSNNSKSPETYNIAFDHKLYALGKDESGNINLYRITVEEIYQSKRNTNDMRFHNLRYIEKVAEVSADALTGKTSSGGSATSATKFSIADLYFLVKRYDHVFNPGKPVDSHFLNADGTPKVFYHGTTSFGFSEFNTEQIYLTSTLENASTYSGTSNITSNINRTMNMLTSQNQKRMIKIIRNMLLFLINYYRMFLRILI